MISASQYTVVFWVSVLRNMIRSEQMRLMLHLLEVHWNCCERRGRRIVFFTVWCKTVSMFSPRTCFLSLAIIANPIDLKLSSNLDMLVKNN